MGEMYVSIGGDEDEDENVGDCRGGLGAIPPVDLRAVKTLAREVRIPIFLSETSICGDCDESGVPRCCNTFLSSRFDDLATGIH